MTPRVRLHRRTAILAFADQLNPRARRPALVKRAIDQGVELPAGYFVTWGGQFRLQQEANRRLAVVVPITLIVIFVLLFSSFNSLRNAALILLNIPLALVGGIVALWLSGQNLSVPASVGFIALFGIALENGMVLVTYLNQLVAEGRDVDEASVEGACLRLRPVLMTAATTALGLLPLLFSSGTGSEVQRPLAVVEVNAVLAPVVSVGDQLELPPGQGVERVSDTEASLRTVPIRCIRQRRPTSMPSGSLTSSGSSWLRSTRPWF